MEEKRNWKTTRNITGELKCMNAGAAFRKYVENAKFIDSYKEQGGVESHNRKCREYKVYRRRKVFQYFVGQHRKLYNPALKSFYEREYRKHCFMTSFVLSQRKRILFKSGCI